MLENTTPRTTPALPMPYIDLDRSQWAIIDRWTPAPVRVVEPLPPLPVWVH